VCGNRFPLGRRKQQDRKVLPLGREPYGNHQFPYMPPFAAGIKSSCSMNLLVPIDCAALAGAAAGGGVPLLLFQAQFLQAL
jgi:hypothetical protein